MATKIYCDRLNCSPFCTDSSCQCSCHKEIKRRRQEENMLSGEQEQQVQTLIEELIELRNQVQELTHKVQRLEERMPSDTEAWRY